MRRIAVITGLVAAAIVVVLGIGADAGEESGDYQVRVILDSGGFLVPAEEVRIAGALVGTIAEVDVTMPGEAAHADGSEEPGKAVVVLDISDPGFQDFREDASCFVQVQSLLGERFIECRATQPRAPSSAPPPPLPVIEEGEPGEGQRLLPLEQNGKAVDLDLVNNIMREPYPDRFRLILNDLGAGLAARGEDLEAVIERANPALRRTDQVLAILAKQNKQLEQLARDSDQVLAPLASQRERVSGFINNATVAAQATAERRADLEEGFQRLPGFLTELEATMTELDSFATNSAPVISDLGDAAPALTRATEALGPFSEAGTTALRSLGRAGEQAGPSLVAADPVLIRIREVAEASGPLGKTLSELLTDLRRNRGYTNLLRFLFNAAGTNNAYDSFGHILRTVVPINNCVDYAPTPESSCESFFTTASKVGPAPLSGKAEDRLARQLGSAFVPEQPVAGSSESPESEALEQLPFSGSADAGAGEAPPEDTDPVAEPTTSEPATKSRKSMQLLLDYLIGSQASDRGERRR